MPVFFAEEGEEINFVFEPHPARDLANALVVPFQFVCAIEILTWTINWWTGMEGKARKSLLSLLPLSKNRAAISEMRRGEPMFSATYRKTSGQRPEVFPPQQTETGAFLHDSGACVRVFAIYKRRVLWYNDGGKESGQECWI